MKNIILNSLIFISLGTFLISCQKDYGNLNSPTAENFLNNASPNDLNNLVTGTESGMRNNSALYLDDVGTIGRELYRFSGSEPRYITDLLGITAQLGSSNFYITNPWASRYRVVKNCNLLIQAAINTKSQLVTSADKAAYIGFAETIKAYQLLLNANLTDTNGIRLSVDDPDNLGPLYPFDVAIDSIQAMLDLGMASLQNGTVSFPLSSGFDGFNDAAGLIQFNRALSARVQVYRKDWTDALTALSGSFFGLDNDFYLGVYHSFGTGSGDQLNPAYIPRNQSGEVRGANPSYAEDIESGDDRISKAPLRNTPASSSYGPTSDRDVWIYTSSTAPMAIVRNEELILIYAEANIQLNNFSEALKAINKIREGHGLNDYSGPSTQTDLINEMLNQKRYSLFCEGHRWIDMRRYGKLQELPLDGGSDIWGQFPLPVSEPAN